MTEKMMSDKLTCPHGQGTCYLMSEVKGLRVELAAAKAAAVQWVTYDGTPETLPPEGSVLLLHYTRRHREDSLVYNHVGTLTNDPRKGACWGVCGCVMYISEGDRWAYLPTPPEAAA